MEYLTNIPQEIEEFGFCKVLNVRYEIIHWKHIFTELFVRKTINLDEILSKLDISMSQYLEYYTNQLRKIHYFTREYRKNLDSIVKDERNSFFKLIELTNGHKNTIILDFDGVCTNNHFKKNLYELCVQRCNVIICTANPTVTFEWFDKQNISKPNKIYACKGKIAKIKRLIELNKQFDYCFYVDNEPEYLQYTWIFGLKTFLYQNKKIKYFSLKSK